MHSAHKKLIGVGVALVVVGVLASSLAPGMFNDLYARVGPNEPLVTYPLAIIVSLCTLAIAPFGATLAAFGVAMHVVGAKMKD
ncbi:hypothetical protein ACTXJU_16465 [Glutamicibacter ardleyensis]|uniref:hypothetical protein n=1 Tax=Glutamicibacter ardleyensis TaxID=225894 RepID=UPI003FB707F7